MATDPSVSFLPWIILPATLLLLAIVAIFIARRGRRMDAHPVCRRCGFDLFGHGADAARCPECGSDLHAKRAVRIGNRVGSPALLIASSVVLLHSIAWLGTGAYFVAANIDHQRYKPDWWLTRETADSRASVRDAAFEELLRRLAAGELSEKRL